MKNRNKKLYIFIPSILLSFFSLASFTLVANQENESVTYSVDDLIKKFHGAYHVEGVANAKTTYPSSYSSLNTADVINVDRDYGTIQIDGTSHSIVNDYSNGTKNIYYDDGNGKLVSDYYTYDGKTVAQQVYDSLSASYFENNYPNPLLYIDGLDLTSNGTNSFVLSNKKAGLILNYYFSLTNSVSNCVITYSEESNSWLLNFEVSDIGGAYVLTSGSQIQFSTAVEASLSLSFDDISFERVSDANETNEELRTSLDKIDNNYTIVLSSDSMTSSVGFYVTSVGILVKKDFNFYGIEEGDEFYLVSSNNKYSKYTYSPTAGVAWFYGGEVNNDTILPKYSLVSEKIFDHDNGNIYTLKQQAKRYVAPYFSPISYSLGDDNGRNGYIKINDEKKVELISTTYYYSGSYITYNQNFLDIGTTSFPSYFNPTDVL